ncbi:MAG: hypothetical protein HW405_148 [Candidatus Berkelbacteria bacterium]|nr:hypothetical protein [Candidatus Berkelbacteria bacterium]
MKSKRTIFIIFGVIIIVLGLGIGGYFICAKYLGSLTSNENSLKGNPSNEEPENKTAESPSAYTLVGYSGQVFGAKVPKGWNVTDNESGIEVVDNTDSLTGSTGVVAVGWFGRQTPDGFIDYMLQAVNAQNVVYENESSQEEVADPNTSLKWVMKTKTFTFTKDGKKIKAKASAGVLNGYGQFMGMITAFQTTPDKWSKWAPTLERIAQSITIINPSKAGGIDKVNLPTAADLANDSSPIMEVWENQNKVGDWSSHEFSDAIMGQETDLYSPSTGTNYTRPLSAYDPTIGGYRNPDNYSEILVDPYKR